MSIRRLLNQIMIVFGMAFVMMGYQNCTVDLSSISFESVSEKDLGGASLFSGNGEGYDGKLAQGTYYERKFAYQCGGQDAIPKFLEVSPSQILFSQIDENSCSYSSQLISESNIEFSPYNDELAGVDSVIYERVPEGVDPVAYDGPIVEAWCQSEGANQVGMDVVVRWNPHTNQTVSTIWMGEYAKGSSTIKRQVEPFAHDRQLLDRAVRYSTTAFELNIDLAGFLIGAPGKYKGHLKAVIDYQEVDQTVFCRTNSGTLSEVKRPAPRKVTEAFTGTRSKIQFIPGGTDLVLIALSAQTGLSALMVESADGRERRVLSKDGQEHREVAWYKISNDGKKIVYSARHMTERYYEVFSVSVDQSHWARISPSLNAGASGLYLSSEFRVSPDSQKVVFFGDFDGDHYGEIHSVNIDGTQKLVISTVNITRSRSSYMNITADSKYVVYIGQETPFSTDALYSSRLGVKGSLKLNNDFKGNGYGKNSGVSHFRLSPDGQKVAYMEDKEYYGVDELYVAKVNQKGGLRLSPKLEEESSSLSSNYFFSSDSQKIVYRFRRPGQQTHRLIGSDVDSGEFIELSQPGQNALTFRISPDSRRVVYMDGPGWKSYERLSSVKLDGTGWVSLYTKNLQTQYGGYSPLISPDSQTVAFLSVPSGDKKSSELFVVPVAGGTARKVNAPLAKGGKVLMGRYTFTHHGSQIAYVSSQESSDMHEIFLASLTEKEPPVRVSGRIPKGMSASWFIRDSESKYLGFTVYEHMQTHNLYHAYLVPLTLTSP